MKIFFLKIFLILICLSGGQVLDAQSLKAYEKAGDKAFEQKDYHAAVQYYGTVLTTDRENWNVQWKYAECARMFFALAEAEKAYEKINERKKAREKFPLLDFRLAEVKLAKGEYAAAATLFEQFIAQKNSTVEAGYFEKANQKIEQCRWAEDAQKKAPKTNITHLGKEINSPFSEFAPIIKGDTVYFSSYKFDKKKDKKEPKGKVTKMLMSVKGGRAREIGRGFPADDSTHVANGAMTRDGYFFFFTFCKNLNVSDIRCELYLTIKDKRGKWSKPQRLPEPVNLKGFSSTHPAIGYDPTLKQKTLWFASDRAGGKGKLDLWSVPLDSAWFCPCIAPEGKKLPKLPAFATPINAEALNTPENDATPFFHQPTQTLYFSTDGRMGFGGYDIYKAQQGGGVFKAPENAGAGINTSFNDLYPTLNGDGKSGYFSSNRPGVFYLDEKNKACCNDLFAFQIPDPEKPKEKPITPAKADSTAWAAQTPPTLPSKPLVPETSLPVVPTVPVELKDFVGLPLYFDNDEPDKRTRRTITKKTYEETVTAYLERQTTYRAQFAEGLKGDAAEKAENDIDDYFDNEVRRGYDRLFQLTDLILERLQKGQTVEVFIKGFTSPRAESDYNLNLGKRRISSVRNHFEAYADGVLKSYILAGTLKITETSFGETTAKAGISDNLKDDRNSVYSPQAAKERRVEIVEIRN